MTLDEARNVLAVRAAEYEAARVKAERLGMIDARSGFAVEYHIADAERDRAWLLLLEAKRDFVRAERIAPESATAGENISEGLTLDILTQMSGK